MTISTTAELRPIDRLRQIHRQLLSLVPTYTGDELARLREVNPAEAGEPNRALRKSHQVFAVPLGDTWHYPRFQFDTHGRPCPQATELLAALGTSVDPWEVLRWFVEPNPRLGGVAPLDAWSLDPVRVIDAARRVH